MLNNVEIFYDPRYEWGYYVKNNIPSNIIKPLFGYSSTWHRAIAISSKRQNPVSIIGDSSIPYSYSLRC